MSRHKKHEEKPEEIKSPGPEMEEEIKLPGVEAERAEPEAGKTEAVDYKDKWLRALAEYENLKKRAAREKLDIIKFSNEQILLELLPIIDDFDRAHEAARQHKDGEVFSKGVEMILSQLHKLLERNGVEKIKTVGEKFDPNIHEAIGTVVADEYPEETVAEEVSPGYMLNGKLLRAAKVKIVQEPKKENEKREAENG